MLDLVSSVSQFPKQGCKSLVFIGFDDFLEKMSKKQKNIGHFFVNQRLIKIGIELNIDY